MGVAIQYEPSWWLAAAAGDEAADGLFEGRLRDAVRESAVADAPCSLIMLDAGGERAAVERALTSAGLDACFTVGERRFAVVLASCDTRAATALARTFVPLGTRAIGVATTTPDRPFADELYASAHVAMVEAERAADRRIVVFGETSAAPTPLDTLESRGAAAGPADGPRPPRLPDAGSGEGAAALHRRRGARGRARRRDGTARAPRRPLRPGRERRPVALQ